MGESQYQGGGGGGGGGGGILPTLCVVFCVSSVLTHFNECGLNFLPQIEANKEALSLKF